MENCVTLGNLKNELRKSTVPQLKSWAKANGYKITKTKKNDICAELAKALQGDLVVAPAVRAAAAAAPAPASHVAAQISRADAIKMFNQALKAYPDLLIAFEEKIKEIRMKEEAAKKRIEVDVQALRNKVIDELNKKVKAPNMPKLYELDQDEMRYIFREPEKYKYGDIIVNSDDWRDIYVKGKGKKDLIEAGSEAGIPEEIVKHFGAEIYFTLFANNDLEADLVSYHVDIEEEYGKYVEKRVKQLKKPGPKRSGQVQPPKRRRGPYMPATCIEQTTAKYRNRKSPPYPANQCCGQILEGNDGQVYISKANVKGICTWRKFKETE